MAQHVYGIDLGTSNIKMYSSSSDNILNEKNVIAIKNKNEIFSFGNQAFEMYEKAPENINVSFPVKFGVIADIKNMETLFSCFYKKLNGGKTVNGADYCIAVPTDVTEVEKRAFYDVILDAKLKAKNITVVEKPIADAVGMGIDVQSPNGHMIVDIGSDTTEISVISLDEDIIAMTYGRNILTGLPNAREISASLIHEAIKELLHQIIENIKLILERTPPELTADIYAKGIYLTGGSAKILNIDKLITEETGLKVNMAENPSETVIRGIASIVTTPELSGLTYIPREKQYN